MQKQDLTIHTLIKVQINATHEKVPWDTSDAPHTVNRKLTHFKHEIHENNKNHDAKAAYQL